MKVRIHATAGVIGFLMILIFWLSTIGSELFGSVETITFVKTGILKGMFILIPSMIVVGASGMKLGGKRKDALAQSKKKRMPFIAANGLVILLPAAVYLQTKAVAGTFDTMFYTIQGLELLAGTTNLVLMGMNIRDGRAMTAQRRKK